MSYFVGIDLPPEKSYVGAIDKKDSRIFGKKLPNDLDVILKALEPFQKKISNGKKKGEGNKKNGNKYLAWAYVEAANFMEIS